MATAPAIVALVGGTVEEAIDFSRQMREITLGEKPQRHHSAARFYGRAVGNRHHPRE